MLLPMRRITAAIVGNRREFSIRNYKEVVNMSAKVYMVPTTPQPCRPIEINLDTCIGCNMCVEVCLHDVFMPNADNKQIPIVLYPEECWFCGSCIEECPVEECITLHHPLKQDISVRWKRKETGEIFRLGMHNPPPPNTRPPSGDPYKVKRPYEDIKKPRSQKGRQVAG